MAHGDILHEDYYISHIYSGRRVQVRYNGRSRIPPSLPADGVFTDIEDNIDYTIVSLDECFLGCDRLEEPPDIPQTVTSMSRCFYACDLLSYAPQIPEGVENIDECFANCYNLDLYNIFTIPSSVVSMVSCFAHCTSLRTTPRFDPNGSPDMTACFYDCSSLYHVLPLPQTQVMDRCFADCRGLLNAPAIPESVEYMDGCFEGCIYLRGNIYVSNKVESAERIFNGTNEQIFILGVGDVRDEWKAITNEYTNVHYEADDHRGPTILLSGQRTDEDGKTSATGSYITVTKQYNYNSDNLPVGWDITLTESMKLDKELITPGQSAPGESVTFTISDHPINETAHTITYTVRDGYRVTTQTIEISKIMALLDFFGNPPNKVYPNDKPGMGMAIGKISTRNGLDIDFPAAIGKGLLFGNTDNYYKTTDTQVEEGKTYYTREQVMELIGNFSEYWEASKTSYGTLQWTVNEDETTIIANGSLTTAPDFSSFRLVSDGNKDYQLSPGLYYMTGCPEDGSEESYYMSSNYGNNYGDGLYFRESSGSTYFSWYLRIINGITVNNLTFEPELYRVIEGNYLYSEVEEPEGNPADQGWYELEQKVSLDKAQLIVGRYNEYVDNVLFAVGGGESEESRHNLLTVVEDNIVAPCTTSYSLDVLQASLSEDINNIVPLDNIPRITEDAFLTISGSYFSSNNSGTLKEFYYELPTKESVIINNSLKISYDENTNAINFVIKENMVNIGTIESDEEVVSLLNRPTPNSSVEVDITNISTDEERTCTFAQTFGTGIQSISYDWGTLWFDEDTLLIWTGTQDKSLVEPFYYSVSFSYTTPNNLNLEVTDWDFKKTAYMYIGSHDVETSTGLNSLVIGDSNRTSGNNSLGVGEGIRVMGDNQLVVGTYNKEAKDKDYLLILGNGLSEHNRSNALTVDSKGNLELNGRINGYKLGANNILWSGAVFMNGSQNIRLASPVSEQLNGIVLVWSAYESGAAKNWHWNFDFIPKHQVLNHGGTGVSCLLMGDALFQHLGSKYVYISDTSIKGHADNTKTGTGSGITYANNHYVLRYVIGV